MTNSDNIPLDKKKYLFISFLILSIFLFFQLEDEQDNPKSSIYKKGGFMLSFDDNYIHNWYEISDLLDKYKCKATFFVSGFGYLDTESINLLKKMEDKGHEIAIHSLNHNSAVQYSDSNNINNYIESEIISEIDSMKLYGFEPLTFAYPFGDNNKELDSVLLEKFILIRDVSESQRHFYSRYFKDVNEIDEVFINDNSSKVLKALGIDKNYNVSIKDIRKIFERANNNNEIILFYCHNPVEKVSDDYQIQIDYLENVLRLSNEYNLTSYRFIDIIKNYF